MPAVSSPQASGHSSNDVRLQRFRHRDLISSRAPVIFKTSLEYYQERHKKNTVKLEISKLMYSGR